MTSDAVSPSRTRTLVGDLVALTKPRIISLLLVTTIAPMFVTWTKAAWSLYKFSLLYLALLFAAMAVDGGFTW